MGLDDIFDEYFPAETPTKAPRRPARAVAAQAVAPIIPLAKRPEALALSAKLAEAIAPEPIPAPPPREMLRLPIGLHLDVSHGDYMDDPGETPSLSASIASILATRAPLHGWHAHPRLGAGRTSNPTPSTGRGSILHKLLLGKGQDIVIVDADDFKTKAAKAERDAALAEGKIPVVAAKFEEFEEVASVLRQRMSARGILLAGQSEVTGLWVKDDVLCRMRIDHLTVADEVVLDDIKTCADASPERIAAAMVDWADDVQYAAYLEGAGVLMPEYVGRIRMRFIFCEAEPPNDVVVLDPPAGWLELGGRKWRRGREVWKRHLEKFGDKEWPGHSIAPVRVGPPAYAVTRESENAANRMEPSNGNVPF